MFAVHDDKISHDDTSAYLQKNDMRLFVGLSAEILNEVSKSFLNSTGSWKRIDLT